MICDIDVPVVYRCEGYLCTYKPYALVRAEEVASGIAAEPAYRRKDSVAVLVGGLDVCSLHAGPAERAF